MASRPFAALGISLALLGGTGAAQAQSDKPMTVGEYAKHFLVVNSIIGQGAAHCRVDTDVMRASVTNQPVFSGQVVRQPTGKYAAIFYERPLDRNSSRFAVNAESILAPGRTEAMQRMVEQDCVGNFSALQSQQSALAAIKTAMASGGISDPATTAYPDLGSYRERPALPNGQTVTTPEPAPVAPPPPARAVTADEFKGMSSDARAMILRGAFQCQVSPEVMRNAFERTPMFTGTIQRHNQTGELSALFQVPVTGEYSRVSESAMMNPARAQALDKAAQPGADCPAGFANQQSNMAAGAKMLEVRTVEQLNRSPGFLKPRAP